MRDDEYLLMIRIALSDYADKMRRFSEHDDLGAERARDYLREARRAQALCERLSRFGARWQPIAAAQRGQAHPLKS